MLSFLMQAAETLVDRDAKRHSIVISDNDTAVLFKKASGRIVIDRKFEDSERAEI